MANGKLIFMSKMKPLFNQIMITYISKMLKKYHCLGLTSKGLDNSLLDNVAQAYQAENFWKSSNKHQTGM